MKSKIRNDFCTYISETTYQQLQTRRKRGYPIGSMCRSRVSRKLKPCIPVKNPSIRASRLNVVIPTSTAFRTSKVEVNANSSRRGGIHRKHSKVSTGVHYSMWVCLQSGLTSFRCGSTLSTNMVHFSVWLLAVCSASREGCVFIVDCFLFLPCWMIRVMD